MPELRGPRVIWLVGGSLGLAYLIWRAVRTRPLSRQWYREIDRARWREGWTEGPYWKLPKERRPS